MERKVITLNSMCPDFGAAEREEPVNDASLECGINSLINR